MGCRQPLTSLALVALGCAPSGCGPVQDPPPVAHRSAVDEVVPPGDAAPQRGALIGGEMIARPIDWPSAPDPLRDQLPAEVVEQLDAAPVPMLVPGEMERETELAISSTAAYGQVIGRAGGHIFTVHGSAQARLFPGSGYTPGDMRLRSGYGHIDQVEGLWSANFIEHGAAYFVEIECATPRDPRCSEEGLIALTESLVVVGGAGFGGGR